VTGVGGHVCSNPKRVGDVGSERPPTLAIHHKDGPTASHHDGYLAKHGAGKGQTQPGKAGLLRCETHRVSFDNTGAAQWVHVFLSGLRAVD
jgi:hypothetical protein